MLEDILEIMKLGYEINEDTPHTVFVQFSGHVKELSVDVHLGGWVSRTYPDWQKYVYLKGGNKKNQADELQEMKSYLSGILEGI